MEDKLLTWIIYAMGGIALALFPIVSTEKKAAFRPISYRLNAFNLSHTVLRKSVCFTILICISLFLPTNSIAALILTLAAAASFLSIKNKQIDLLYFFISFLALCVSATLPWWRRHNNILETGHINLLLYCFFLFLFDFFFKKNEFLDKQNVSIKWLFFYLCLASFLSFSTGWFHNPQAFLTLWHHWGAYVGPSELLLSGATIFHDFPAQYGLGPTLMIASLCKSNCWQAMYFISALALLAFSTLIAALALALTGKHWTIRLLVLVLSIASCFFWQAYPPLVSTPLISPSVSGLRFLPVLSLVAYLFFTQHIEYSKLKCSIAHVLWALGILWSPESAFYVTFVWWPYYIFIHRTQGQLSSKIKAFVKSAIILVLLGASFITFFIFLFHIIYHKSLTFYGVLAYVLHPPGMMRINAHGLIWYFLVIVFIGCATLMNLWHKTGDSFLFRAGFLITLLTYSTFSYFLGRSHDNNILNLTPFILLILLHSRAVEDQSRLSQSMNKASIVFISAIIGWLPVFGWSAWHNTLQQAKFFSFEPQLVPQALTEINHPAGADFGIKTVLTDDVLHAVAFIRQSSNEPITLLNSSMMLLNTTPIAWSAFHNLANYAFIPSKQRREFLQATSQSIHRSGWLIVDRKFSAYEFLPDFDFVYRRTQRLEFGDYYAIHYQPKERI